MNLASSPTITGGSLSGNATNGVSVDGGTLPGNTAWNAPDIVYRLAGDVTVPEGTTLTVTSGQIVKFHGSAIFVQGTLDARGTAEAPIVFTSLYDDTAGGDTDNDPVAAPANGHWNRIEFTSTSTGSVLEHVQLRYGGGWSSGVLYVNGGELTLTNSAIRNSVSAGLRIQNGTPTLTGNAFTNNSGAAISMDMISNPTIVGGTLTNNAVNGVNVDAGELPGNTAWDDPDIVYRLMGDVTVPEGATLTIAPGQVVKFHGSSLFVRGVLDARGTAASPIVFTSLFDDTAGGDTDNNLAAQPIAGHWNRIEFTPTSKGSVLEHVRVRYGGGWSPAQVYVNRGELSLTNSQLHHSISAGIRIEDSDPTLIDNTFRDNTGAAASMDLASNPHIRGVTLVDNAINGLALDSGALVGDASWDDADIVYWLGGDVTVPAGTTLRIAPGQIAKLRYESLSGRAKTELRVDGTLVAEECHPPPSSSLPTEIPPSAAIPTPTGRPAARCRATGTESASRAAATFSIMSKCAMAVAGGSVH